MSLATLPELSLPMSAILTFVFFCTLLCLAKASCIQLGTSVLTVFPLVLRIEIFQVHDCLHLQGCSDCCEEVLGISWKKCKAAGSLLFTYSM